MTRSAHCQGILADVQNAMIDVFLDVRFFVFASDAAQSDGFTFIHPFFSGSVEPIHPLLLKISICLHRFQLVASSLLWKVHVIGVADQSHLHSSVGSNQIRLCRAYHQLPPG